MTVFIFRWFTKIINFYFSCSSINLYIISFNQFSKGKLPKRVIIVYITSGIKANFIF